MIQAIVFLPLIGALIAGLIMLLGAHGRCPSGDEMDHAHGHDDHAHGTSAPIGGVRSAVRSFRNSAWPAS